MLRITTPGVMYSSICASALILWYTFLRYIPSLYTQYAATYKSLVPDMSLYFPTTVALGIVTVLMSGAMLVGLTVKIGQVLGDILN